jgi:hypothetical protein
MFTQIALGLVVFNRAYLLDQPDDQFRDISIILLLSSFGYWGARLYFGGLLPVISLKGLVIAYVALVLIIAIPTSIIHGLPRMDELGTTILPVLIGSGVIVGGYAILAYLGKRRIEKEINQE